MNSRNSQGPGRMNDEELSRLYAQRESTHAEGSHLSEDDWERLALSKASPAERDRWTLHIATCKTCAATLSAIHEVSAEARRIDPRAPVSAAARSMWPYGIAAAA